MKKQYEVEVISPEVTEDMEREIVEGIYKILSKSEGEENDD